MESSINSCRIFDSSDSRGRTAVVPSTLTNTTPMLAFSVFAAVLCADGQFPIRKGLSMRRLGVTLAAARAKSADVCVKKYVRKWGDLPQSLMWIFLRLPTLW